jgi:hypothetical protein
MPRGKASRTKKLTIHEDSEFTGMDVQTPPVTSKGLRLFTVKNIIIVVILILVVLAWKFKGYFIVATVNGQPISRFELNDQLISRFGAQTIDSMINERLIMGAARQKGIFISAGEIDARVKEIEGRLQGQKLADALTAQGLTEPMFRHQLEVQLSIEKLFDKEATVSPKEIEDYIAQNSVALKNATDTAALQADVTANLKQQKISELFDKWFTDVKKNASVKKFL